MLMMSDGKEELGWVAVEIVHSVLRMLHMEVPGAQPEALTGESVFIADSLMRAAASYGAAVGAYKIRSLEPAWNEFLRLRGFTPGGNGRRDRLEHHCQIHRSQISGHHGKLLIFSQNTCQSPANGV